MLVSIQNLMPLPFSKNLRFFEKIYVLRLLDLPKNTNEDGVMELCGMTCTHVWIARKADIDQCAGFAFAEFANEADLLAASALLVAMGVQFDVVPSMPLFDEPNSIFEKIENFSKMIGEPINIDGLILLTGGNSSDVERRRTLIGTASAAATNTAAVSRSS
jgi:hypothetical protein